MKLNRKITEKSFLLGPVLMMFSAVLFAFMAYFVKLATATISSPEVTFFRLFVGVSVALTLAVQGKVKLITENMRLLFVRGFVGGIAVLLFFLAIGQGTVTNSVVLQNSFPIFAALTSAYILKEKLTLRLISFILITFAGIVILIRPDLSQIRSGEIYALVSAMLGGYATTSIRQLRQKNESAWTIFFYFCIFGAILSFVIALPSWKWPQLREWIPICLTALLGMIAQLCMTSAYKYCTTTVGGIISMSTSIFSFIIGIALLHESVYMLDLVGVMTIIAGNVMVIAFGGTETKTPKEAENLPL